MKYVYYDETTNEFIGWLTERHATYIEAVYDDDMNVVTDGYYDISTLAQPNFEVADEIYTAYFVTNPKPNKANPTTGTLYYEDTRTDEELMSGNAELFESKLDAFILETCKANDIKDFINAVYLTAFTNTKQTLAQNLVIYINGIRNIVEEYIEGLTTIEDIAIWEEFKTANIADFVYVEAEAEVPESFINTIIPAEFEAGLDAYIDSVCSANGIANFTDAVYLTASPNIKKDLAQSLVIYISGIRVLITEYFESLASPDDALSWEAYKSADIADFIYSAPEETTVTITYDPETGNLIQG